MSTVASEQVLVLPTAEFHQLGYFQGFCADVDRYLPELVESDHLSYRPRGQMEDDPGFKQLIPYCVFRHVDDGGQVRCFQYCRGKGQGEARLRAKRSVGVGGHISSADADAVAGRIASVYDEGLRRELAEEVEINSPYSSRIAGLINDDETDVGRVHLGVVHLFDVQSPRVAPREPDILDAAFLPVADIVDDIEKFESWSQIVIRALLA